MKRVEKQNIEEEIKKQNMEIKEEKGHDNDADETEEEKEDKY